VKLAFILGSGLGEFAEELEEAQSIKFESIPHFKTSTVVGHAGKLVLGKCKGVNILCMQGRYHFYEGHSL
jgi:purine-nucleoside phosphorylase